MKAIFIPTLFLFSFLNSQSEGITNDVIQYGFNYFGDLKDGKRHGNGKYTRMEIPMKVIGIMVSEREKEHLHLKMIVILM